MRLSEFTATGNVLTLDVLFGDPRGSGSMAICRDMAQVVAALGTRSSGCS